MFTECLAPIFSLKSSLWFYRSLEYVQSASVDRDFNFMPNETLMTYLLVATKELAEIRSTDCPEEFLEDLPLRPAHLKIGLNNFTLLDIWWKNATNLREPTKDVKLIAQYGGSGLNPEEAKVHVYEYLNLFLKCHGLSRKMI